MNFIENKRSKFNIAILSVLVLVLAFASFAPGAGAQSNKAQNGIGQTISKLAKDSEGKGNFGQVASEIAKSGNNGEVSFEIPESVDFDLTKNEKQEYRFTNSLGEEVVYGAEPIPSEEEFTTLGLNNNTYPISSGTSTWNIYHYSGAINMSYKITISRTSTSTKITNAYDLSVTLIGYSESNRYFGLRSSKKAEYSGTATLAKYIPISLTIWLISEISSDGKTLTTRAKS